MWMYRRVLSFVGVLALLGALINPSMTFAQQPDAGPNQPQPGQEAPEGPDGPNGPGGPPGLPPQTLRTGYESYGELRQDAERTAHGPTYSAWIVESSRFVDVPAGSFMPDRA